MARADLLIHARWVAPVDGTDRLLDWHSVAVGDGRIEAVLPSDQAVRRYPAAAEVSLARHLLIPGLIDAHTHAAMTLLRGLADDLPLMTWLQEHIWPAEQRWVNEAFVRDGTLLAAAELLRGGVTCFNDMYFHPEVTARVVDETGLRAVLGLILIDFPTTYAADPDEYLDKGLRLHDEYRDHPRVHTAFAPHAPYSVSDQPLQRVRMLSDELDIPVHMHVHETRDELRQGMEAQGIRPLARLERLGLLNPNLVAVHMTQLEDEEIAQVAEAGVRVVHCPESNLKLASGFCPVARLLDAGIEVALGTDGAASNNDLDMIGEMRTAALLAKGVAGDASVLPAWRALEMATRDGARALGLGEITGSIEPGKAADLCALDLGRLETSPLYHPVSQLVYAGQRSQVTDVWVAGRHLLREGELTTIDTEAVQDRARVWQRRLAED